MFFAGEIVLLLGVIGLSLAGLLPKFTVLAFIPALVRGVAWFLRKQQPLDVHRLGFSELFQSIAFGAVLCTAFLV
jgi:hypothetical protein